ncbi:hypothetical protein GWL_03490 [Herbaspirillum sp. GW103]|nr:hypothetical protein GWL_03490 [Herbaspirillum sp. GW103]
MRGGTGNGRYQHRGWRTRALCGRHGNRTFCTQGARENRKPATGEGRGGVQWGRF